MLLLQMYHHSLSPRGDVQQPPAIPILRIITLMLNQEALLMTNDLGDKQALRRAASRRLAKSTARLKRLNDQRLTADKVLPLWKDSEDR